MRSIAMICSIAIFILCTTTVVADQLVQVQYVWRHGDRSPLHCYPTDPNLPYWSQWPEGELSTMGMSQHYNQGLRLKQRYMDQLGLLNATYNRNEILVQSSFSPRCIQSAASNMAGMFSSSQGTHPDNQGWPGGWTPIPIHTMEGVYEHMLDANHNCPRLDELMTERGANEKFAEWELLREPMLKTMTENSGENIFEFRQLLHIYDCMLIEKVYRNLSQPAWVTESLFKELGDTNDRTADFLYGEADFGVGEDIEILKIRGGKLLKQLLDNMAAAQNGTTAVKMYIYSAHDTTVSALMRVLGVKQALVGHPNPDYAAMIGTELWNGPSGYYVKLVYSANESTPIRTVTQLMRDCLGGDSCPYNVFYGRSRPYLVDKAAELCEKVL